MRVPLRDVSHPYPQCSIALKTTVSNCLMSVPNFAEAHDFCWSFLLAPRYLDDSLGAAFNNFWHNAHIRNLAQGSPIKPEKLRPSILKMLIVDMTFTYVSWYKAARIGECGSKMAHFLKTCLAFLHKNFGYRRCCRTQGMVKFTGAV